jgi:DMSO/TMAO reductase YedYZ molybdopterin-dependent catalytic subunit
MKKLLFSSATAIITIMLVAISFWSGLNPTARAESSGAEWQLTVTGLVEQQLNLSLTEITVMPRTTVNAAIICVDFPGNVVAEGNWTGVNLWLLLETAGVSPSAVKVAFYASDGFSTDLSLETAKREDIILAYEKDGSPLGEALRLVVPGKWGYKWISQVTRIEVVDYDFIGFWESRGYSDTADVAEGSSSPPQFSYPDPRGTVPEFPLGMIILVPLILVTLFALMLKNRAKGRLVFRKTF